MKLNLSSQGWQALTQAMRESFLSNSNRAAEWNTNSVEDSPDYREIERLINASIFSKMKNCWESCTDKRCYLLEEKEDIKSSNFVYPCFKERNKIDEDKYHVSKRSLMRLLYKKETSFQKGFISACFLFAGKDLEKMLITDISHFSHINNIPVVINPLKEENNEENIKTEDAFETKDLRNRDHDNRFYNKYRWHARSILSLLALILIVYFIREKSATHNSEKAIRSFYDNLSKGIEYQNSLPEKSQEYFNAAWMCFSSRSQEDRIAKFKQVGIKLPDEFGQLYSGSGMHQILSIEALPSHSPELQEFNVTYYVSEIMAESPLINFDPKVAEISNGLRDSLVEKISTRLKKCYEINDSIKIDSIINKIVRVQDLYSPGLIKSIALQLRLKNKPNLERTNFIYMHKIKIYTSGGSPKIDGIMPIGSWEKK